MRLLKAVSLALFGMSAFVPVAYAAETLDVAIHCPQEGEFAACLLMNIGGPRNQTNQAAAQAAAHPSADLSRTVRVRGRLVGQRAADYDLRSTQPGHMFNGANDLGPVAYLGRSSRNRPLIITDRGPFEILTRALDAPYPGTVLIDARTKHIVARFLEPAPGATLMVRASAGIVVWDSIRELCISAPRNGAGLLTLSDGDCRPQTPASAYEVRFASDLNAAGLDKLAYLKLVEREARGLPNYNFAAFGRIPGTQIIAAKIYPTDGREEDDDDSCCAD